MNGDKRYVTTLNPNDVLFGRGSGPNDHEGNIKFRELVAQRKAEYMATNHRQTKAKIARAIVDAVFASNGQFLKKVEAAEAQQLGLPNGVDAYVVVDDDTIMEKAKQALRQNRDKNSKDTDSTKKEPPSDAANARPMGQTMMPPDPYIKYMAGQPAGQQVGGLPGTVEYGRQDEFRQPDPIASKNLYGANNTNNNNNNNNLPQNPPENNDSEFITYTTRLADSSDDKVQRRRDRPPVMEGGGNSRRDMMTSMGSLGYSSGRRGSFLSARGKDGHKRESLRLDDVWRRESMMGIRGESMEMSDLLNSFKGMSTSGEDGAFDNSADTIGTIEPLNDHMSGLSNMSIVSMSSTNTFFKSQDLDAASRGVFQEDQFRESSFAFRERNGQPSDASMAASRAGTFDSGMPVTRDSVTSGITSVSGLTNRDSMYSTASGISGASRSGEGVFQRESIAPAELWGSKTINNLLSAPIQESSTNLHLADDPRPVQLMQEQPDNLSHLGGSSMSIVRSAFENSLASQRTSSMLSASATQSVFDINQTRNSSSSGSGRVLPQAEQQS